MIEPREPWEGTDWRCDWERWRSSFRREPCVSQGLWMWWRCARCWSAWSDDRTTGRNAHLDRRGSDGSAAWIYGLEWHGADGPAGEPIFGTRVCVSRPARSPD